jgi:glucose 1-dehydrogenase
MATHEMEIADFDRVLSVDLRGPLLCAREAIRHFLARGGQGVILHNSSVHEMIPQPRYASYAISKGGLENMTRTPALEYAGRGNRVNAVGPGAVVTPINRAWVDNPKARGEVESFRRRCLHHRPNPLRLRRPDPLSRVPRGMVFWRVRRKP